MDCKDFENLLPLYHDGELNPEDRRRVDVHVKACAGCRDALAFYAELESSLTERRSLRPHAGRTAERVIDQLGLRPRPSVFSGLLSLPGLASLVLVVTGLFLLVIKNPFVELPATLSQMGEGFSFGLSPKLTSWMNELSQVSGTGEYTLIGMYLGVFALIMLLGSWMVLRFVRD
jgi:hypothetical protein